MTVSRPGGAPGRMRLVLVEDCADDAELLYFQLEDAGLALDLVRVEDAAALRAALAAGADAVVSDVSLPRFSGLEALAIVRAHDHALPFVFCSGAADARVDEAVREGLALAHVLKDALARLPALLAGAVDQARVRSGHAGTG